MILVDTCVLIDVSASDPTWRDWSINQLAKWRVRGPLVTGVGAHAAVTGTPLLTRDRRRFDTCFAGLEIVAPE